MKYIYEAGFLKISGMACQGASSMRGVSVASLLVEELSESFPVVAGQGEGEPADTDISGLDTSV